MHTIRSKMELKMTVMVLGASALEGRISPVRVPWTPGFCLIVARPSNVPPIRSSGVHAIRADSQPKHTASSTGAESVVPRAGGFSALLGQDLDLHRPQIHTDHPRRARGDSAVDLMNF